MAEKTLSQFRISNETYDIYDKEAQDCLIDTDLINGNLNLDGDAVVNKTLKVMLEKDEPVLSTSEDEDKIKGWQTEDGVYLIPFVQSSQSSSYWEAVLPKPLFNNSNCISNYTFKWFDGSQELDNFSTLPSTNEEWSVEINGQSEQMFSTQDAQHNILSFAINWANDSNYFPNQEPKIKISGLFVKYKHPSQIIATVDNIEIQSNTISASGDVNIDGNIAANSAIIDGNVTIGGTFSVSGLSDPKAFQKALQIRTGVVASQSVAAGDKALINITFNPSFNSSAEPKVICGLYSSTTQTELMGNCSVIARSITATGFTAVLVNSSSSARNFGCHWIAIV